MPALVPIVARQNVTQSSGSSSFVPANCSTAALAVGVEYLVIYRGSFGGSRVSGSASPELRLRHNGDTLAECAARTDPGSPAVQWSGSQAQGFARITGAGQPVEFEMRATQGDVHAGAMAIVAIPINELVEDTEFFETGTNSGTNEETNVPVEPTWTTIRELSFTPRDAGDYLLMVSVEGQARVAADAAVRVLWEVDGAQARFTTTDNGNSQKQRLNNSDWFGMSFSALATLTKAPYTVTILGQSRTEPRNRYRRSRIWAIRARTFTQALEIVNDDGLGTLSQSYVPFMNLPYVPKQTEDVLVLASTYVGYRVQGGAALMQLVSSGQARCVDSGEACNEGGFSAASDNPPLMMLDVDQGVSDPTAYATECKSTTGAVPESAYGRTRENDEGSFSTIVAMSMELQSPDGEVATISGATGAVQVGVFPRNDVDAFEMRRHDKAFDAKRQTRAFEMKRGA